MPDPKRAHGLLNAADPMNLANPAMAPITSRTPAEKVGIAKVTRYREAERRVGGRFKLTVLLQKRAVELMRGAPPLVQTESISPKDVALDEILAGKIELIAEEPIQPAAEPGGIKPS